MLRWNTLQELPPSSTAMRIHSRSRRGQSDDAGEKGGGQGEQDVVFPRPAVFAFCRREPGVRRTLHVRSNPLYAAPTQSSPHGLGTCHRSTLRLGQFTIIPPTFDPIQQPVSCTGRVSPLVLYRRVVLGRSHLTPRPASNHHALRRVSLGPRADAGKSSVPRQPTGYGHAV